MKRFISIFMSLLIIGGLSISVYAFSNSSNNDNMLDEYTIFTNDINGLKKYSYFNENGKQKLLATKDISKTVENINYNIKVITDKNGKIATLDTNDNNTYMFSNNNKNKYVMYDYTNNKAYNLDLDSYDLSPIITDTYHEFNINQYQELANKTDRYLGWCDNIALNQKGDKFLYWSNKNLDKGKPDLTDGVWLYSFDDAKEMQLIKSSGKESICPYFSWLNDNQFTYQIMNEDGTVDCFVYSFYDNSKKMIKHFENTTCYNVDKNYIFYVNENEPELLYVYDIINRNEEVFNINNIGHINAFSVKSSDNGKIAIPNSNDNSIFIIDNNLKSTEIIEYGGKVDLIEISNWSSNNQIVINVQEDINDIRTFGSYIVNLNN